MNNQIQDGTTADYLQNLVNDRDTMVTNLNTMGVPAEANETFTDLAQRILEIPQGDDIQYDTMPVPSIDYLDKIVQYVGETTLQEPIYTNGYFYKCISDGQDPATYSWENINVQDLPIASASTLGGIKVGNGLSIDALTGILSAAGGLPSINTSSANLELWDVNNDVNIKNAGAGVFKLVPNGTDKQTISGILISTNLATNGIDSASQLIIWLPPILDNQLAKGVTLMYRYKISWGNWTQFKTNYYPILNTKSNSPSLTSNDYNKQYLIRCLDLMNYYGTKAKADLTTTNKDSLVDAINEVNTKINNLVDANNISY